MGTNLFPEEDVIYGMERWLQRHPANLMTTVISMFQWAGACPLAQCGSLKN